MLRKSQSSILVCLVYATCCCLAWPAVPEYQRAYNYYPAMDYDARADQWDMAQQPLTYDQTDDDYYNDGDSQLDVNALANLAEFYDTYYPRRESMWSPVVEKPESELEELKVLQQEQQQENDLKRQKVVATSTSAPTMSVKATAPVKPGQKEIPLLRPPANKAKLPVSPPPKPEAVIAQRSSGAVEKPSAYDKLRQYLSLEDALKKEAEKRRATGNRQQKRSSGSGIVADEASLTGQLNNLKKSAN